jgi:hypothetical protein
MNNMQALKKKSYKFLKIHSFLQMTVDAGYACNCGAATQMPCIYNSKQIIIPFEHPKMSAGHAPAHAVQNYGRGGQVPINTAKHNYSDFANTDSQNILCHSATTLTSSLNLQTLLTALLWLLTKPLWLSTKPLWLSTKLLWTEMVTVWRFINFMLFFSNKINIIINLKSEKI